MEHAKSQWPRLGATGEPHMHPNCRGAFLRPLVDAKCDALNRETEGIGSLNPERCALGYGIVEHGFRETATDAAWLWV